MKKVLLATTALAFSAGWAMADVTNAGDGVGASITLTGEGKIGVIGNDRDEGATFVDSNNDGIPDLFGGYGARDASARFYTDVDLKFTMRGMTDSGLEFGLEVDLDEGNAFDGETQGGETLWLKGAFGNLTMGDTDGAFDWAMSESIIGGTIGDVAEHSGYSGNSGLDAIYDGQIARYDYTFGDMGFGVAVSATLDDYDEGDPVLGIGARYTWEGDGFGVTFGGGYQWVDSLGDRGLAGALLTRGLIGDEFGVSIWGLSADVAFGAFHFIIDYAEMSYEDAIADSGSHWGVALGYDWDEWVFAINYGIAEDFIEIDTSGDTDIFTLGDAEGFALTANYNLGGGASLQAGIAHNTDTPLVYDNATDRFVLGDEESFVSYSFGVSMRF